MIAEILSNYHNLSTSDPHHRYKSWEHCYTYFSDNHNQLDEESLDKGCLHLAFYLGSWGMLRGGSFLLQKDYRIHQYFLREVVADPKFHTYFDTDHKMNLELEHLEGLDELIERTKQSYVHHISSINGEEKTANLTDTLLSKILLGVFGNVPAYDRYFKHALKLHGISPSFDEKSMEQIVEFYQRHKDVFDSCQRRFLMEGTIYTPMKLIDMYFFQIGYMVDKSEEESEEMNRVTAFVETFALENKTSPRRKVKQAGLTEKIRTYLVEQLDQAKEDGLDYVDLKSGDVHKDMQLRHRIPSVCSAMVSLDKFEYEILHDTPSGASSTRLIRYYL